MLQQIFDSGVHFLNADFLISQPIPMLWTIHLNRLMETSSWDDSNNLSQYSIWLRKKEIFHKLLTVHMIIYSSEDWGIVKIISFMKEFCFCHCFKIICMEKNTPPTSKWTCPVARLDVSILTESLVWGNSFEQGWMAFQSYFRFPHLDYEL